VRSLRALLMTLTEDRAMATAMIGDSRIPKKGGRGRRAAIGIPARAGSAECSTSSFATVRERGRFP